MASTNTLNVFSQLQGVCFGTQRQTIGHKMGASLWIIMQYIQDVFVLT